MVSLLAAGVVRAQESTAPAARTVAADTRIAELEARVATLELEVKQLRAAMRSAGTALVAAAGGGDAHANANANANASTNGSAPVPVPVPVPLPPATAGTPQEVRAGLGFTSLPPGARARFVEGLRERQHQIANASPEERQAMIQEVLEMARREDAAPGTAAATAAAAAARAGTSMPLPQVMPVPEGVGERVVIGSGGSSGGGRDEGGGATSNANASAVTSTDTPAGMTPAAVSHDETRLRFEALSEEQKRRFIEEMRRNRERISNATPAEREAFTRETLTKVEMEAGKANAGAREKADTAPAPQKPEAGKKE